MRVHYLNEKQLYVRVLPRLHAHACMNVVLELTLPGRIQCQEETKLKQQPIKTKSPIKNNNKFGGGGG